MISDYLWDFDALGYSAGAAGPTYSVDRLCFDGCIWRP
jgi:hypothetical protein